MSYNQRKAGRSKRNDNPRLKASTKKESRSTRRKGTATREEADMQETLWDGPVSEFEEEEVDEEDDEDEDDDEPEFEVEEILEKKIKKGVIHYLVKWKGFSLEDTTWEPETNLENAPLKIRNFENQLLTKDKDKEKDKEKEKEKEKEKVETPTKGKSAKAPTDQKEGVKVNEPAPVTKAVNKEVVPATKQTDLKSSLEPESLIGKRMRDQLEDETDATKLPEENRKKVKKPAEKKKGAEGTVKPLVEENKKAEKEEKAKRKEAETTKPEKKGAKQEKSAMTVEEKAPSITVTQDKAPAFEEEEDELTFKIKKLSGKSNSMRIDSEAGETNQERREETLHEEKATNPLFTSQSSSEKPYQATSSNIGQIDIMQGRSPHLTGNTLEVPQKAGQIVNKDVSGGITSKKDEGVTLSRIMQDEKLMEGSETEEPSINNDNFEAETRENAPTSKSGGRPITKLKKKTGGEYGSLDKGDIPLKVIGIRPIKEENDLEVMISWKARENGTKPYNSKVMRLEMLKNGHWMPLIEFYESKMKLESSPNFDPGNLPKY